jgi:hypothetical protein
MLATYDSSVFYLENVVCHILYISLGDRHSPVLQCAVSWCPHFVIHCIAVNIWFLVMLIIEIKHGGIVSFSSQVHITSI